MVTGAIFGSFTQKNLAAYPYVAANVAVNPTTSASGGLARPAILKKLGRHRLHGTPRGRRYREVRHLP